MLKAPLILVITQCCPVEIVSVYTVQHGAQLTGGCWTYTCAQRSWETGFWSMNLDIPSDNMVTMFWTAQWTWFGVSSCTELPGCVVLGYPGSFHGSGLLWHGCTYMWSQYPFFASITVLMIRTFRFLPGSAKWRQVHYLEAGWFWPGQACGEAYIYCVWDAHICSSWNSFWER